MKVIKRSCDLPIAVLHAHPDNPRKDVGDVTELAESIKQNGIFQNLTVVKGGKGSPNADGYTAFVNGTGNSNVATAQAVLGYIAAH